MDSDERLHIQKLVGIHTKRLAILKTKQAYTGASTPAEILMEIDDIQREIAQLHDRLSRSKAIMVDLLTHVAVAKLDPTTIQYDWTAHFRDHTLPPTVFWRDNLLPDIQSLRERVDRTSTEPTLTVRQRAHLSIGFAFGYTFSERSRIRIWVEQQSGDEQVEWWRTSEAHPSIELQPLLRDGDPVEGDPTSADTVIELSITRDIRATVVPWLTASGYTLREYIRLMPHTGPDRESVPDDVHALAIARQVSKLLVKTHDASPSGTIHLFASLPFGLAVMIGMRLNACAPVQCYEFDKAHNTYIPTCRLT